MELYSDEDEVVAFHIDFSREEKLDYLVLINGFYTVAEYGFSANDYVLDLERRAEGSKVYYFGGLEYFSEKDNELYSFDDVKEPQGSVTKKRDRMRSWRRDKNSKLAKAPVAGDAGIQTGCTYPDSSYYSGDQHFISPYITYDSVYSPLHFEEMSHFWGTGNCGPISLLNLFIFFDAAGKVSAYDGSRPLIRNSAGQPDLNATYDILAQKCGFVSGQGTIPSNKFQAIRDYAVDRRFVPELTQLSGAQFSYMASYLDQSLPIVMTISTVTAAGSDWIHGILAVGYKSFKKDVQKGFLWWTWTETETVYYLRIVDGWSTCNSGRYLIENFYNVEAVAVNLKEQ